MKMVAGWSRVLGLSLFAVGIYSILALGLDRMGISMPSFFLLPVILPGYVLSSLGMSSPFVGTGGGFAWLTFWGVSLFYFIPGGAFVVLGRRHQDS